MSKPEAGLRERMEDLFYEAFTEDRDAEANADPLTLGDRCKKYAAKAAELAADRNNPVSTDKELSGEVEQVIYFVHSKCLNWKDFMAFLPLRIVDLIREREAAARKD